MSLKPSAQFIQGLRRCPLCKVTRTVVWHPECEQFYCPTCGVETTTVSHRGQEDDDERQEPRRPEVV